MHYIKPKNEVRRDNSQVGGNDDSNNKSDK